MILLYILTGTLSLLLLNDFYKRSFLKPFNPSAVSDDFCIIDIRDYISAHRSPYPGAENIPLSYLSRALNERFECPKEILLVTDDKRGAKIAAKMIKKKQNKPVYYVQS
ncbi:rhodanese-like domain-containing protein [Halobacillus sp. KCTC 3957]|uniref:Rhodanese-like domain-containing protein n=2 Tax=Halobacillus yeomjeoni TaxID=311194 RepID=A0A931HWC7_9BACI|nr:rhodanese-like domain-containing protein [Halobacillus yeomjeoni]